MTNDEVKAIQERAEKATEAPMEGSAWLVVETTDDGFCIPGVAYLMGTNAKANADFIAHAREDIPMLLKALAEAREEIKNLRLTLRPFAVFGLHIVPKAADDDELLPDLAVAHFRNATAILGGSE